jgi:AraC-like DNA-binding protein/mannose-6-phosphate isomerase-like protein (cupin superfamily)
MPSMLAQEAATHNELVDYQNALLRLKIWQLNRTGPLANSEVLPLLRWHYHKEVEFVAILEGSLSLQTKHDTRLLQSGDVYVVGSSQLHRTQRESSTLNYIVCQFDLAQHFDESTMPYLHYFSEIHQPLGQLNYMFSQQAGVRKQAHALILDILAETQSNLRGSELAISASIRRLLLLLLRNDTQGVLHSAERVELKRLQPLLDYVEQHLDEKISIGQACALLNLSYHYFIKYFKKVMDLSFVDYVNYKRIKKAERLLLTQATLSIVEVGDAVGITNMAQFYRLFKRHNHCSPKEFKLRMKVEL